MENNRWLRFTLIQVAAFILIVAVLDSLIFQEEFRPTKYVIGALIYGLLMGYSNYRNRNKNP